jgi:hypothetical protein
VGPARTEKSLTATSIMCGFACSPWKIFPPAALAQPGGVALGAQAGPAAVRQLAGDAGFSRFRQVTQTPVNVVLELRP